MDVDQERQELINEMLGTKLRTLEEVRAVIKKAIAWLEKHPNDPEVLGAGESLAMLEAAFVDLGDESLANER